VGISELTAIPPLCLAVEGAHIEIVAVLLDELKCDVVMVYSQSVSIVSLAVIHDHIQRVEAVLLRVANQYTRYLVVRSFIEFGTFLEEKEMVHILCWYGTRQSMWYYTAKKV
jgi:hypothetical protein